MILADSSIWIDNLKKANADFIAKLQTGGIYMHPYVTAELALGHLKNRTKILRWYASLPHISIASHAELLKTIESHGLYGRGVGFVDAHLLASVLLTPGTLLWTRDKRLRAVAEESGIHVNLN